MYSPTLSEHQMLRAIAQGAVAEALLLGNAHAEFHHYRIDAWRTRPFRSRKALLSLVVRFDDAVIEDDSILVEAL